MIAACSIAVVTSGLAVAALAMLLACTVVPAQGTLSRRATLGLQGAAGGQWSRRGSRHCVIFVVDIAGFAAASAGDDEVQLAVRDALYGLLIRAFSDSAITWEQCFHEDRGDGVLVIIPARWPSITVIHPLLTHLHALLRRHNRLAREPAKIRLRVGIHAGEVHRDAYGFVGAAVNHAFRLLDAPVLKEALAFHGAELALIVSDYMYENVVRHSRALIDPAAFQPVIAEIKETRARAWIHLPGSAAVRADGRPLHRGTSGGPSQAKQRQTKQRQGSDGVRRRCRGAGSSTRPSSAGLPSR
jgi:class 3 adenylate cyclase